MHEEKIVKLNIDLLEPSPYQPRRQFNETALKELALSIREFGILNPILVRQKETKYEIIAGERRYRAAKLLGLKEVPVIVKQIDDEKAIEIALIENLQRENITPIEEAMVYQKILEQTDKTEKELSEMIGKSQPFIANKIRLLNLPAFVKEAVINKKISERHARTLLSVKDEKKQEDLLVQIIREKLTVKELEKIISNEKVTNEKKEEKESDNMNNGNFFPNFNNGPEVNNNQASLNTMNMQAMEPVQNPMEQQSPMTAAPAMPQMAPPVEMPNPMPTPNAEPAPNELGVGPIPNFNMAAPAAPAPAVTPDANVAPLPMPETAPINDIPLLNPQEVAPMPMENQQPMPEPAMPSPEVPAPAPEAPAPMMDAPLFNSELQVPGIDMNQPAPAPAPEAPAQFEVPVATAEPTVPQDRMTEVTELLKNNNIEFKAYNSENGHCIIIEL